jgi:hypothetical protein
VYEAAAVGPERVLVYDPLEPVHHETVEGSTERIGFRYHISFLKFSGKRGQMTVSSKLAKRVVRALIRWLMVTQTVAVERIGEGPSLHAYAALRGLSGDSGPSVIAVYSNTLTPFLDCLGR